MNSYLFDHPRVRFEISPNNRTRQPGENRHITLEGELSIGVSLPTYKIVYERGTEDVIVNTEMETERAILEERAKERRSIISEELRGYF